MLEKVFMKKNYGIFLIISFSLVVRIIPYYNIAINNNPGSVFSTYIFTLE